MFNTGGIGAESNEQAAGDRYRNIPKELTLMLQEALLRGAVSFEYDARLGSEIAVAIVNMRGEEVLDLRKEWLPRTIYGEVDYNRRVVELSRRRYYGRDPQDNAGILRYTKVTDALIDLDDIPTPTSERELAWLLSFYWHVDEAQDTLSFLADHRGEGTRPASHLLRELRRVYETSVAQGLQLENSTLRALGTLGVS